MPFTLIVRAGRDMGRFCGVGAVGDRASSRDKAASVRRSRIRRESNAGLISPRSAETGFHLDGTMMRGVRCAQNRRWLDGNATGGSAVPAIRQTYGRSDIAKVSL